VNIYYVYQYLREDNTPYYIGKGKEKRAWASHRRSNGSQLLPTDKSRIQIIQDGLTEKEAHDLETELIKKYGLKSEGGILVNLTYGGEGRSPGPELRDLFRRQQTGRKRSPRTEEHRKNLSKSLKGQSKPRSPEHQAALNESLKKNWATNFERKKQQSERISKINKERKASPETLEKRRQSMLRYWQEKRSKISDNARRTDRDLSS
jgi:hypothetical protein